ncbi:DNA primase [Flavobacterium sp. AJR]|jgi:DNA-directed RNA polymerase subunit delta|uniref:DNA primase n=1 Tax=unclassified Flavobacterium TaxID=196869 RepID=UPI000A3D6466|nr:DNA primase [Flavobacterium sp. AJR]OUL60408.1 DNA primase [Flavobacterium sp. AJR]
MKRVIVDYAKLTNEILNLLVDKFPDGYDDSDVIRFRNAKNELIEAVEVRTEDTIYLVKISTKLADRIENYDEDDEIDADVDTIEPIKGLDLDDDAADDDDDEDENLDKPDLDGDDDDEDREKDIADEDDDEEDED